MVSSPAPTAHSPNRSHIAAANFRAILNALARPGRVETAIPFRAAPEPLFPAAAAILTTLVDTDAPYWLSPRLRTPEIDAYARFETSAAAAQDPGQADFLLGDWSEIAPIATAGRLRIGTAEYPDRSATLILTVEALAQTADGGCTVCVDGPGVETQHRFQLALSEQADAFFAFLARNRTGFPLGVDVILTAHDRLVGLPRTARVMREA
ncbi:MAG: phosphonate C-P lyase system protein PhnH [Neomegalonema sp.]|nr:phosphonate C-P lyase system protein PhnH [Neomegalonema sp.]